MSILNNIFVNGINVNQFIYNDIELLQIYNITYYIDSNVSYTERIVKGDSILSPSSFTPTKSGYTFVGWREDTTASSTVLSDTTATSNMTLYAVFNKTITVSYNGNGSTSGSTASNTGKIYYNNGDIKAAEITLSASGFSKNYNKFKNWAISSDSGTQYAAGTKVLLTSDTTFYAIWDIIEPIYLFNNGTDYSFKLVKNTTLDTGSSFSVGSSYITLNGYANNCSYQFYTTNPVDVTDYKYITMIFTLPTNKAHVRFGVGLSKNNTSYGSYGTGGGFTYGPSMSVYQYSSVYNTTTATAQVILTCDISSLSGDYYPTIFQHDGSSEKTCVLRVHKYYLHNDTIASITAGAQQLIYNDGIKGFPGWSASRTLTGDILSWGSGNGLQSHLVANVPCTVNVSGGITFTDVDNYDEKGGYVCEVYLYKNEEISSTISNGTNLTQKTWSNLSLSLNTGDSVSIRVRGGVVKVPASPRTRFDVHTSNPIVFTATPI